MDSEIIGQLRECRNRLVVCDVEMNKIVERILVCDSRQQIDQLLSDSRKLLLSSDHQLDVMDSVAHRILQQPEKDTYQTEVDERRKQFKSLNHEVKMAVTQRLSIIEKQQRSELIGNVLKGPQDAPGTRVFMKQEDLVKNTTHVTDNLARITRNIAQELTHSGETIKTLEASSEALKTVSAEFQNMGSTITQGSHLIDKYDRRQFTDKILITLAFTFFFLVCCYIVNKRLFGGFNWFSFLIEFFFPTENDLVTIGPLPANAIKREL